MSINKRILKISLGFVFSVLFSISSHAQMQWGWARSIGGSNNDIFQKVVTDSKNGVYALGNFRSTSLLVGATTLSNAGGSDVVLVKYDTLGNVIWAQSFGSLGDDTAYSITTDKNSNVIIVGSFKNTINFGGTTLTSAGGSDAFFVKLNSNGIVIWAKHNTAGSLEDKAEVVKADKYNNIYLAGRYKSNDFTIGDEVFTTEGLTTTFYCKLDSNGNFLWKKRNVSSSGIYYLYDFEFLNNTNTTVLMAGHITASTGTGQVTFNPNFFPLNPIITTYSTTFRVVLDLGGNYISQNSYGLSRQRSGGIAVSKNAKIQECGYNVSSTSFQFTANVTGDMGDNRTNTPGACSNCQADELTANDIIVTNSSQLFSVGAFRQDDPNVFINLNNGITIPTTSAAIGQRGGIFVWELDSNSISKNILYATINGSHPSLNQQLSSIALDTATNIMYAAGYFTATNTNANFSIGSNTLVSAGQVDAFIVKILPPVVACPAPTAVAVNTITSTTANVTWSGTANPYIVEYGPTGFTPGTGAIAGSGSSLVVSGNSPITLTVLSLSTTYQVYFRQNCSSSGNGYSLNSAVFSFTTLASPPINDEATGAITLLVGGGCTGAIYDNTNATQSAPEPYPSCKGTAGYGGMWYKFVAPGSGSVMVSCDEAVGSFGDSRMALFSASNSANYSTFNIISCDDNNGFINDGRSLFYTVGLVPGNTYYLLIDLNNEITPKGSYCIFVDELNASMLANAVGDCINDANTIQNFNPNYRGWVSLVDANGKLNVNVRQNSGVAVNFNSNRTIKTGAPRVDGVGQAYLNRNFLISGNGTTSADVQLFFLDAEVSTLGGAIIGYNVSKVSGAICNSNFTGSSSLLVQNSRGSSNGANYIQVATSGFSNFYIMNSLTVLPISIEFFNGIKHNNQNLLNWKINCTTSPLITIYIERSSDGREFKEIHNQTVTNSRCLQDFNYTDQSSLNGINYYRLKIVELTGEINYSKIILLQNNENSFDLINLIPNPAKNVTTLNLTSAKDETIEIFVNDMLGRNVYAQTTSIIVGVNLIDINIMPLNTGKYLITAKNVKGEIKTIHFIKY